MKSRVLVLVAAAMIAGCAHADGFSGKWMGMTKGNLLTMSVKSAGHYVAKSGVASFAFATRGDTLHGYMRPAAIGVTVDVVKVDANHIRFISTANGVGQEYCRQGHCRH